MKPEQSKASILTRLAAERRRLVRNLAGLSPEQMVLPGVVVEWSVKDVLAHLAEWEELGLGWVAASRRGETPAVPFPGFSWRRIDQLNEHIYRKHRDRPLAEVTSDFHSIHARFIAMVEGMTEQELLAPGYFPWIEGQAFYAWAVGFANHDAWGKAKIRAWRKALTL